MLSDHCTRSTCARKTKFSKVPEFVQTDARLVGCDLRLLVRLIHYAWGSGVCWPSIGRLAADLSLATRTVQLALGRLYRTGYVSTRPSANRTGREFVLHLDAPGMDQASRTKPAQPVAPPPLPPAAPLPLPSVAPKVDVPSKQTQNSSRTRPEGTEREKPGRTASLLEITRALAAQGDPIAQRELERREQPRPAPYQPPATVDALIQELDQHPANRAQLAGALSRLWDDHKSYKFYWKIAMHRDRDAIHRAYLAASQPSAVNPGAIFTALLRTRQ